MVLSVAGRRRRKITLLKRESVVFECDACGEELETGERDFDDARDQLKREGWIVRRAGNRWLHFCTDHDEDEMEEAT